MHALRSVTAHTNNARNRTAVLTYDEYGKPGPTNTGRFQYTGQIWLNDAGLYHYKNRAYHPEMMRFLQTDPIGVNGGINLYAYVGGDPINFSDPTGLSRIPGGDMGGFYDYTWGCDGDVCELRGHWRPRFSLATGGGGRPSLGAQAGTPACATVGGPAPSNEEQLPGVTPNSSLEDVAMASLNSNNIAMAFLSGVAADKEAYGLIYGLGDGVFVSGAELGTSGSVPNAFERSYLMPRGAAPIAGWHTHGRWNPNVDAGASALDVTGSFPELIFDNWGDLYLYDGEGGVGFGTAPGHIDGFGSYEAEYTDLESLGRLPGVEAGMPGMCR